MSLKFKISRRKLIVIILLMCLVGLSLIMPGMISALVSVLIVLVIAVVGNNASRKGDATTVAIIVAIPILLAATQNVYLGIAVSHQSPLSLQILLSLHFLLILLLVALNYRIILREAGWCLLLIIVLIFQGMFLFFIYPATITSAISALRNVLSCMLIYLYAFSLCRKCDVDRFYKVAELIAWFVVLFGLFEYFSGNGVWKQLGITQLWNLKGISTNAAGIPMNWYSSERIAGNQIRRMVSSFADPVNLGTYLFAAFMLAWFKKRKVLMALLLVCCLLTISKGALLSFLILMVVFVWYKDKSKIAVPLIGSACVVVAGCFVQYSLTSSTGSMMAHIMGFLNSFEVLLTNPFGLGIGNVGVLSGLFSKNLANTSVAETGIGVIIAQLGWIGLICYIVFFVKLFKFPKRCKNGSVDAKIVYYTLMISFIANAVFNEVALSPNSCALYFIEIAILNRQMTREKAS